MATVYDIWQIEKQVWLKGPQESRDLVLPSALILTPPQHAAQRFKDYVEATTGVKPFTDVSFDDRVYSDHDGTTVIAYVATAHHPEIEDEYRASCSTIYVDTPEGVKVLAHHQVPLGSD